LLTKVIIEHLIPKAVNEVRILYRYCKGNVFVDGRIFDFGRFNWNPIELGKRYLAYRLLFYVLMPSRSCSSSKFVRGAEDPQPC
jgi:hypothetical protein